MLLRELYQQLNEVVGSGHWRATIDTNGVRHWMPDFNSDQSTLEYDSTHIAIPSKYANFDKPSSAKYKAPMPIINGARYPVGVFAYAPFELPAKGVSITKLPPQDEAIMRDLMDALKGRDPKNVIDPNVMQHIMEMCLNRILPDVATFGVAKQMSKFNIIVTVPSSSNIAKQFAETLRTRLGISSDFTHHDTLQKRDIISVYDDIKAANIPDDAKQAMLTQVERGMNNNDMDFKLKHIRSGNRHHLNNGDVNIFEPTQALIQTPNSVNTLILVDDNFQTNTSFVHTAKTVIEHYGVKPKQIIGIGMFKYNM